MLEADMTVSPPITSPVTQFLWHALNGRPWPIILIVGNNWVTAENPTTYTVNADELATHAQVEALLVEAGGIGQWHSSE